MKRKDAYQIIINGQKLYFDYSLSGFKGIQYLAWKLNRTIKAKLVKVSVDKNLLELSDLMEEE